MSKYDYNYGEEPQQPKKKAAPAPSKFSGIETWDILTIFALLLTACLVLYFAAIFVSPNASYNPLPPKNSKAGAPAVTPTYTPIQLEPTWTLTPSPVPSVTPTLFPTFTPFPSPTPFSLIPATKTPIPSATSKAPFAVSFEGIKSTIINPDTSCNWQAVGGTIVDANGAHINAVRVTLNGVYNGKMISEITVSGVTPVYGGISGFEFFLGEKPVATKGSLVLQLLDQNGAPLSSAVPINTYDDCGQNLTLVRFVKNP